MAKIFIHDDFLLQTKTARLLYHEHAERMPIYDYHCHLPPGQIADDITFENLMQAWLRDDHYKWRAMRTNGVAERYCTGDAPDYEKFEKWAQTVPAAIRNPLYHWTHLELKRYFGIDEMLDGRSARRIYDAAGEMLRTPEFSACNIMRKMNVKVVCTTDEPTDTLEHHRRIADDGFEIRVAPAWRPSRGMAVENVDLLNDWIDQLARSADVEIRNFQTYLDAFRKRHDYFHQMGCRISDHALETVFAEDYTQAQIDSIFLKIRARKPLDQAEQLKFKSAMLYEFGLMDHEKNWVQQYHLGAIRNNNYRLFKKLGCDTGLDSIGQFEIARPLAKLLDRLDTTHQLAKTILYNLNPADNEVMASMIGNFQDGSVPGKMQYGSAWWFLDQKDGMEKQINALSSLGLLSRFIGMTTDSRSFLSYCRHEYFRRILCNLIGRDVENGEIPSDMKLLGDMVENICFNNARDYFGIEPA
jgi:glucuronate isomerase